MMKKHLNNDNLPDDQHLNAEGYSAALRELAENIVREKSEKNRNNGTPLSPEEMQKIIHELEIHQVELTMQNKELLRIQEELEKSREWYLNLYDHSPAGYFTLNNEGFFIEANLTSASLLGTRRNSLYKQPFTRFINPEDQDIFYLHQKELFKNGKKQLFELRIKKTDGSLCWIQMETTLAYGEDNSLNCRAVISDITERKIMEYEKLMLQEQIMQNQRFESLGNLAGGIAHNFNNLLSGIFGYIELADRKAGDSNVSRYLSEALSMSEKAKALTGQLLTFAKGGAPIKKNGYLFPLVRDSVQFALSGSDIACRFNIEENLKPCNFDTNQIYQVIENVIINARQAMPEGGIIDIAANNIFLHKNTIATLPEGMYVKISIMDSGIGMTPDILSKIFDPFFTTKVSGHGLGLSTGFSIISRHGGTINIESEPGKWTRVNIYIPAITGTIQSIEKETSPENHSGNGTLIVMDNEECIRDSLSAMLMSMGYDVIYMEDGVEVISFFKKRKNDDEQISGIFLDLVIPGGMGGKEVVSEIRKTLPDVPVFAISGYTYDPAITNPLDHGFTSSISKPFLMSELADMLNHYMKKNQPDSI